MSSGESLTQKWLRHTVQPYELRDRVYSDVDAALGRFPTLRPKSDVYTYDDGRTQLLLCIHGLLPISFRSASYNIPIAIWLTRGYPKEPPIAYVVPTINMLVKAGKYIDVSGRCDIEFLQHWARKSEGCNISALLEAMQDQFSREPPVYAKPPENASAGTSPRVNPDNDPRGRPPPPLPPTTTMNAGSTQSPSFPPDVPMLPPRPTTSAYPIPGTQTSTSRPPIQTVRFRPSPGALGSRSEPPLPPRPPLDTLPPQYRISYAAPPTPPNHAIPAASVIEVTAPAPYLPHQSPRAHPFNSASPVSLPGSHSTPPLPLPASSTHYYHQIPFHPPPPIHPIPKPPGAPIVNLLDEDSPDIQISNVTPAFAPPPPRPPNPELLRLHDQVHHKLTSELSSLSQALALDAERLRAHQTDLLAGEPAIRDEMARLEAVRDVCRSVAGRVKGAVQQAEINIAELRRKGDPEVDELICSTTIVHNQLISLVAEDNAIEDTIYHLHRALNSGRIDLERFLRASSTRLLAEEQFMKRALIEKIQQGMPMGMSLGSDWS
ncbi:UEV domain-containing protein [Lyophyllum atratum]|nr:UEV domain-containing protein [Lyophyllum atratum]